MSIRNSNSMASTQVRSPTHLRTTLTSPTAPCALLGGEIAGNVTPVWNRR